MREKVTTCETALDYVDCHGNENIANVPTLFQNLYRESLTCKGCEFSKNDTHYSTRSVLQHYNLTSLLVHREGILYQPPWDVTCCAAPLCVESHHQYHRDLGYFFIYVWYYEEKKYCRTKISLAALTNTQQSLLKMGSVWPMDKMLKYLFVQQTFL